MSSLNKMFCTIIGKLLRNNHYVGTALLHNKDRINDLPVSSGYNVVVEQVCSMIQHNINIRPVNVM